MNRSNAQYKSSGKSADVCIVFFFSNDSQRLILELTIDEIIGSVVINYRTKHRETNSSTDQFTGFVNAVLNSLNL